MRAPAEPREQLVTAEAAVAALGKCEQAEKGAAGDPRVQWHHRGAVHREAGSSELVVGEPGVRFGIREHQRDPVESSARPYRIDHRPERRPHLFVRIGDGHDPRPGRVDDVHRVELVSRGGRAATEPLDRSVGRGVGARVAGGAGDHDHLLPLFGHRTEQRRTVERDPLRQVHDDPPELTCQRMSFLERLGGGVEQVLLVVPGRLERPAHLAVQPDDVGGPR